MLPSRTLELSKIGEVKIILHRPIPDGFEIKQATILSKADGWYVSFSLEDKTVPNALSRDKITTVTGIDVGLEKFLTTADGESVEVPQYYRKAQSALARQQRQLARKIIGSKNYKKQANTLARLHLHVARQRKEFHYHVAHWLVNSYDLIVFENLNIRGLARTRLALSILDVAWGAFLQIMQAVAVKRGKLTLGVDARNTSINCSSCGERVEKTLAVRIHSCSCGLVIDRDWNSALNLLKRGLALSEVVRASVSEGEGSVGLPIPGCGGLGDTQPVKQQVSFVNLRCSRYTACGVAGELSLAYVPDFGKVFEDCCHSSREQPCWVFDESDCWSTLVDDAEHFAPQSRPGVVESFFVSSVTGATTGKSATQNVELSSVATVVGNICVDWNSWLFMAQL